MGLKISRRAEWYGRVDTLGPKLTVKPFELWLHHSVTQLTIDWQADMRRIEDVGIERFGRFSYSWAYHALTRRFIEGAGDTVGAHTKDHNSFSLGLVLIGNYHDREFLDPQEVADLGEGIDWLENTGRLVPGVYPTGGHRDLKQTSCPGDHAYMRLDQIRGYRPAPPPQEDDDMKATLSWLPDPRTPEAEAHLYLVDGAVATHVDGQEAKNIALMRGATADSSSRENVHKPAFLKQVHILDGPLRGL